MGVDWGGGKKPSIRCVPGYPIGRGNLKGTYWVMPGYAALSWKMLLFLLRQLTERCVQYTHCRSVLLCCPVYCHCLHSMRSRVYVTEECPSVRPSVYPSMGQLQQPAAAGLLLWARRAGDVDRLLQQQRAAGQCHVVSVRRYS